MISRAPRPRRGVLDQRQPVDRRRQGAPGRQARTRCSSPSTRSRRSVEDIQAGDGRSTPRSRGRRSEIGADAVQGRRRRRPQAAGARSARSCRSPSSTPTTRRRGRARPLPLPHHVVARARPRATAGAASAAPTRTAVGTTVATYRRLLRRGGGRPAAPHGERVAATLAPRLAGARRGARGHRRRRGAGRPLELLAINARTELLAPATPRASARCSGGSTAAAWLAQTWDWHPDLAPAPRRRGPSVDRAAVVHDGHRGRHARQARAQRRAASRAG